MALILTRKVGEQIIIEGGVALSIVSISGKQVRIAIEANGRKVYRREVLDGGGLETTKTIGKAAK